jgi:hypothetical protein
VCSLPPLFPNSPSTSHSFKIMAINHAGNDYAMRLAAQARTPEQYKVEPRMYFHQFNYAKFHVDLGGSHVKSIQFANYRYITDDKREQDQLELVADVPGTFIYTVADSDVAAAMKQELQQENVRSIMQAAAASAAANHLPFDPSAPIIPVNVQHVTATQVSVAPVSGGFVGVQNSLSGTVPTETGNVPFTTANEQTRAPNAADEAVARLNAMASAAK